ncbi:MAG: complex I subunit 1 family protein [Myxococcaceae bacterium]
MRIGFLIISVGLIVGGFFGVSALGYAAAGGLEWVGVEKLGGFHGLGHIGSILVLMLVAVMVLATLLTMAERKWSALIQNRVGPNRIRVPIPGLKNNALFGLPHIAPDVLKMLTKEAFRPKAANAFLFNLAPMLAFGPVFALFAIVPAGPSLEVFGNKVMMVAANPDFGLLYLFAIASLAVYGTSLAGWSSNNKFALLGGVRASSQMISYEVALGLSLVGMMICFSTVRLAGPGGMAEAQMAYLWSTKVNGVFDLGLPQWGIFLQPLGFLLFFAASFAETKRAPFDTPEGESEIVGYFLEYSGMQFGLFMISEFVEVVVLSGVLVTIFFGAWWLPFGNEWLLAQNIPGLLMGAIFGTVFWLKVLALVFLQLLIRWTFPRFRYDQVQNLGWKILLPLGLVNLFVTGALILWDPSLRLLALFGFVVIGAFAFLTMTAPRQVRAEEEAHGHGHDDHGHGGGAHDDGHALQGGH